jgi:hypothetical protein
LNLNFERHTENTKRNTKDKSLETKTLKETQKTSSKRNTE